MVLMMNWLNTPRSLSLVSYKKEEGIKFFKENVNNLVVSKNFYFTNYNIHANC